MGKLWLKFKHSIVCWLWKGNEWTGLIDAIDQATEDISEGYVDKINIPLRFKYLKHDSFNLTVSKSDS